MCDPPLPDHRAARRRIVLTAPCGNKYEFVGDISLVPLGHSETAVRFRDFLRAIGVDPDRWLLQVFASRPAHDILVVNVQL